MTLQALSESSPVTIGLTGGLLLIAFYLGQLTGQVRTEQGAMKAEQVNHAAAIAGLNTVVHRHEVRIAAAERELSLPPEKVAAQ